MFFPLLWAKSPSRIVATAVSASYFLSASRGLPQGVANFYTADFWPGLLLWVLASASFTLVHAVLWNKRPEVGRSINLGSRVRHPTRYLAAMVLMGLPPFGVTGWAHPLTAAGVLFPGWGWWGLLVTAVGLLVTTTRRWPAAILALGGFWFWSVATWTSLSRLEGWAGVDLSLGKSLGRDHSLQHHHTLVAAARRSASLSPRIDVVVLPESALGYWTPTVERLWREGLRGSDITVIAGAAIVNPQGYDNVMVSISAGNAAIFYRERMPVPVSMWQPWRVLTGEGGGARAHFFATPIAEVAGIKIAPLICYEQLILWPILQSMLHAPDIIVATGNGWWTSGTTIIAIQKASIRSWSRLFNVPIVMSFNQNSLHS
jgi:hypothetical protein